MSLETLAIDALNMILERVDAFDLGHLWCVGCKKLQWSLSEGGAIRKLDYRFDTCFPLTWPHLVRHLPKLRHLSVVIHDWHRSLLDFTAQMTELPRNIKSLTLKFENAISQFNKAFIKDASLFSNLESLFLEQSSRADSETTDLRQLEALKDLNIQTFAQAFYYLPALHLPPHLTRLAATLFYVSPEWIQSLPESLESLDLRICNYSSFYHLLPRNLRGLSILFIDSKQIPSDISTDILPHLPQSLTYLTMNGFCEFTPSMASQLPKTLIKLCIKSHRMKETEIDLLNIVKQLPHGLQKMDGIFWWQPIDKPFALALPRSLRQYIPTNVAPDAISSLPQGIESLHCNIEDFSFDEPISSFPSGLTFIDNLPFIPAHLKILPKGIRSISNIFKGIEALTPELTLLLPPFLTHLSLRCQSKPITVSAQAESFRYLPRTLSILSLDFVVDHSSPISAMIQLGNSIIRKEENERNSIELVAAEVAKELPPNLSSLTLQNMPAQEDFYRYLPLNLKRICIMGKSLAISSSFEAWKEFPDLESISISTHTPPEHWRPVLANLPKKLKMLHWDRAMNEHNNKPLWTTDLTNEDMKSLLPRSLTHLSLPQSPLVNEECKTYLPKFLSHLILQRVPDWATIPVMKQK